MMTAAEYYGKLSKVPPLSSGDPTLDGLLGGGFIRGPVHFLYGPKNLLPLILMRTAVNALSAPVDGGLDVRKIAYVDGMNRFNPYFISKMAVARRLSPNAVLNQIMLARTFQWNQMVQLLEEKLFLLEDIDLILVSGMTSLFEEMAQTAREQTPNDRFGKKAFQDLNRMFAGLKYITEKSNPIIILTGPLHSKSQYRPAGGRLLSHFCGVIIGISEQSHYLDYRLDQHPFLANRRERFWKPGDMLPDALSKRRSKRDPRNTTLDLFMQKPQLNLLSTVENK